MLDEALLRPGRLEVQIEIGLPDQPGRLQILKIHTSKVGGVCCLLPIGLGRAEEAGSLPACFAHCE
jgi:hypothetical protein